MSRETPFNKGINTFNNFTIATMALDTSAEIVNTAGQAFLRAIEQMPDTLGLLSGGPMYPVYAIAPVSGELRNRKRVKCL